MVSLGTREMVSLKNRGPGYTAHETCENGDGEVGGRGSPGTREMVSLGTREMVSLKLTPESREMVIQDGDMVLANLSTEKKTGALPISKETCEMMCPVHGIKLTEPPVCPTQVPCGKVVSIPRSPDSREMVIQDGDMVLANLSTEKKTGALPISRETCEMMFPVPGEPGFTANGSPWLGPRDLATTSGPVGFHPRLTKPKPGYTVIGFPLSVYMAKPVGVCPELMKPRADPVQLVTALGFPLATALGFPLAVAPSRQPRTEHGYRLSVAWTTGYGQTSG